MLGIFEKSKRLTTGLIMRRTSIRQILQWLTARHHLKSLKGSEIKSPFAGNKPVDNFEKEIKKKY